VIGAEVHAGFLPWSDHSWRMVLGESQVELAAEDRARNTAYRSWSVLFGDGVGAMILDRDDAVSSGILGSALHTDGRSFELIWVPGVGFRQRPYLSSDQTAEDHHLPVMDGAGLHRKAVGLEVREVLDMVGLGVDDLDLVIAHRASDRILDGVRRQLGAGPENVPSNIASYGTRPRPPSRFSITSSGLLGASRPGR
jgi:3-oxoacyl-[acyl-carrier-protein] synthase III